MSFVRVSPTRTTPHVLEAQQYQTEDAAEYDSWLLLEPLEQLVQPSSATA